MEMTAKRFTWALCLFVGVAVFLLPSITREKPNQIISKISGYTLYWRNQGEKTVAILLDEEGEEFHRWVDHKPLDGWKDAQLLPDGDLLVLKKGKRKKKGGMVRFSWMGKVKSTFAYHVHHRFSLRSNGNIVALCRNFEKNPVIVLKGKARDDCLVEFDHTGQVVWHWSINQNFQALEQDGVSFPRIEEDWAHANDVVVIARNQFGEKDRRFRAGNLLVSLRQLSRLIVVDRQSGEIVWVWGKNTLDGQHSPKILPNGHLLVLDNGYFKRKYSRVLEVDLQTEKIVWQYDARGEEVGFYTPGAGSVERLENGNTLVSQAFSGRIFELSPNKETVWEFLNPRLKKLPPRVQKAFRNAKRSHWEFLTEKQLQKFKTIEAKRYSTEFIQKIIQLHESRA